MKTRISVVNDISLLSDDAQAEWMTTFLTAMMKLPPALHQPYLVVIDEVQRLARRSKSSKSRDAIERVAKQGRKRGVTLLVATQRVTPLADAVAALEAILPGVSAPGFMHYGPFDWNGTKLIVSRSGYTGEDGFEILCAREFAVDLWNTILGDERVRPVGLGARDSLRLEAGLPLYGHDLDDTVSPIEAGLNFAVSKRRREARDFPGASRILAELAGQLTRIRVGLFVEGAPARENTTIFDQHGIGVGRVTSGGFSPSLNRAIALGFVTPGHEVPGTKLQVEVRGRLQPAEVTTLPFVPHRYVRKATA